MNKFAPLEYTQPLRPEAMDHEPSTKPCGHNVSTVTPNAQLDLLADPNCCKPLGHTGRQANIYEVSGHYAYTSIRLCCHGALDNSTRFVFIRVYGAMYAIFHKQCRRTDIGLCTLKMHCGWHKSFQAKMNDSSTFIIVENLTSKSLLHIFWWAKKKRWPVIIKVDIHTQICQSMKWNYSKRRGSGRNENGYFERIPLYDNFPRETFARHKIAAFFFFRFIVFIDFCSSRAQARISTAHKMYSLYNVCRERFIEGNSQIVEIVCRPQKVTYAMLLPPRLLTPSAMPSREHPTMTREAEERAHSTKKKRIIKKRNISTIIVFTFCCNK